MIIKVNKEKNVLQIFGEHETLFTRLDEDGERTAGMNIYADGMSVQVRYMSLVNLKGKNKFIRFFKNIKYFWNLCK